MSALTETWQIHNRINMYLLESIDDANLTDIAKSKGRNVGEHFAHIHNVRLMWLKVADPGLLEGLVKLEKEQISKAGLLANLQASGNVIAQLFDQSDGRIKGFKPHATAFLGYLISHESHHRGQVMLCLKQSGHPADKKIAYGIWEWGTR